MRNALRWAALSVLLGGTVFWLFGGPNLGWTKTQVPIPMKDPVTENEYVEWQDNFVPGVDFLAACWGLAAVAGAVSWLGARRRPTPPAPPATPA